MLDDLAALAGSASGDTVSVPARAMRSLAGAVPRLKATLMFSVWDEDLGDYAAFHRWVKEGAPEPVPQGLEAPAAYYLDRQGDGT